MVLLQSSDFDIYVAAWSVPVQDGIQVFTGSVGLVLSTGVTQLVFDRVSTASTCIQYMEATKLYYLCPNEDITITTLRSQLLVLENTCINLQMMNSYVFTYHGSEVRAIHRSMSETVSLTEALASCGFRCVGLPWDVDSSPKMQENRVDRHRPRIQVVDYVCEPPNSSYTNIKDASPIVSAGGLTGHDFSNPQYP